jgi:hypothetical protein
MGGRDVENTEREESERKRVESHCDKPASQERGRRG